MKKGDQLSIFYRCADDGDVMKLRRPSSEDHCLTIFECVKLMDEADSWDWVPEGMLDYVSDYLDVDLEKYTCEGVDNDRLFEALYSACNNDL